MTPLDRAWLQAHPLPQPEADTDKNKRGRVLVAGGSAMVPGALRLTGEAALRAGAGKLQLATIDPAALPLGLLMPEAAVFALPTDDAGELAPAAGEALCAMLDRCDTLVLGPGMGEANAAAILRPVLAAADAVSLVLDAAMLPAAAEMAEAIRARHGNTVLTPHPGEMIRLMGCDKSRVREAPEALACEAADRFGATVLLKGPETWVASPGETALRYGGGGMGLATGGSGDVLAGIIGALLARDTPPPIAAAWGVWLHGEAGRRLAETVGPLGFLGRELPAQIPALMAAMR